MGYEEQSMPRERFPAMAYEARAGCADWNSEPVIVSRITMFSGVSLHGASATTGCSQKHDNAKHWRRVPTKTSKLWYGRPDHGMLSAVSFTYERTGRQVRPVSGVLDVPEV